MRCPRHRGGAAVMGDSAARILDAAPARDQDTAADLVEAPAYRAELAVRTGDPDRRPGPATRTGDPDRRPGPATRTGDPDRRPGPATRTGDPDRP
ncbi:hypothetical protein, partial [Herbidospora sp. NBRC 101105]|uniref:hypothetical protein n=1 Tax=Herbidospora sp. NBRC 101105 TaxID=3032195 RepID=UPI00255418FB